jgi:hypothetical protein
MVQPKSQISKRTNPLDFFIERGGYVIENENGWCNFYVSGEYCYLENMYVYPHARKKQNGTSLLSNLELQLVEMHKCKYLTTTISRASGNPDLTLGICLKRGFKFSFSNDDAIVLKKEL